MYVIGMGIDPNDVAELSTSVGTSNALGAGGMAADPIFELTIAIVVLTSSGISGD